ncbi:pfh1, partial [Symbiodinium microadriaticum]
MFYPAEKEARAVAFTAWQGHAFFYKNARSVYQCDDAERLRPRFRSERRELGVPEFAHWREWDGQPRSGHFWRWPRGTAPCRVAMRSLCEWRSLRLRAGEADCASAWPGATNEVFLHLLRVQREVPQQREQILASQGGACKLCGAPIALGTCEFDHVVPVSTAFRGQIQEFQALCHECHRLKTGLENSQATALERRFSPTACEAYVNSPRLPPLVCGLQKWKEDRVCWGVDVVRCRKNGLANARFPLPVFCPLDSVQEAREGRLADLTYVKLPRDGRVALLSRLPYVGEDWYAKPACAFMLDAGIATWGDFLWSLDATAHEEHLAKLSVNALIGLWARNVDLVYLMRTSNNQLDGNGCQYRQTFVDAAGNTHWDHIFVAQLFSNASHRPAWDFVMAAEYCAVARIRQLLAEVPMRYLKFLKTDCLGFQDLPKKFWPAVERLTRLTHPDGTPIYRCEQVEQLRGRHYEPEIAARPPERRGWERVEDPVAHCLRGRSLLLTGLPGAGKTHLA